MDDENMPIGVLEIAGYDVSSLLWEQDEIEQAVKELALFPIFVSTSQKPLTSSITPPHFGSKSSAILNAPDQ